MLLNKMPGPDGAKFFCALLSATLATMVAGEAVSADTGALASLAEGVHTPQVQQEEAFKEAAVEGDAEEEVFAPNRGRLVVFASEKIGDAWIASYFNSLPEGQAAYNQCELSLGETFDELGYDMAENGFSKRQRAEARRLRTVFGRYRDMSSMANDTAVKASDIVDGSAGTVVLCTADVGPRRSWRKKRFRSCAEVRCKAVSTESGRRLATHSIERCAAGPGETAASVEAIRSVCSEAAHAMGNKLVLKQGDGL